LYYSILKPIRSSVAACKSIAAGNLDARIPDKGNDEIAYLSANIDNTIEAMRDMLYQQKRDSEKQRELEIEVLRYQINPHFLLNTLGTLKWMAVVHDVPVLDEITSALGKILENTLVDKRKFIPLSEEMDTLKEYVLIQKARYAEKFESVFDIQTEAAILPIPKFILQPLMENAILHGAYDNGRVILIEVSAAIRGNILRVEINDNGRGFDPNNMTRTGRGSIGIANVRQRLMSIYGHGAELIIESRPEHGTCCVLKMPLAKPEKII
jgi:two-component system sensor histidine kinase YesM